MARLGGLVPAGSVARSRAAEPKVAARVNSLFRDFDVLMTPVTARPAPAVGRWEGRGAIRTLNGAAGTARSRRCGTSPASRRPRCRPASTAPGCRLSVQLIGPPNDEATLLSLAAQIEAERPWAHLRPAVS